MSLLVLCPSRSRPDAARVLAETFHETATRSDSELVFVVDNDDPQLGGYREAGVSIQLYRGQNGKGMVPALNAAAAHFASHTNYTYIGFVGDDHRFITHGWDETIHAVLDGVGGGLAYGNDLVWRNGELPTQVFMSASIIDALGYMGLPTCRHLYIDNAWLKLGEAIDAIYYLPDVIIEHRHPSVGKAVWDEQYISYNNVDRYSEDGQAFGEWVEHGLATDAAKAKLALARYRNGVLADPT